MAQKATTPATDKNSVPVGGTILAAGDIEYNVGRSTVTIEVHNMGDRPIQVGSHFHFFEVNRYLSFDRSKAFGYHLNIPATTAIRFEPGDARQVELVAYAGRRRIVGFGGLTNGYAGTEDEPSYLPRHCSSVARAKAAGYKFEE